MHGDSALFLDLHPRPAGSLVPGCTHESMREVAMNSITAESSTLEQIFGGNSLFEIPYYQRPYAWDEEEAGVLLGDFLTQLGTREPAAVDQYFLGTIVVARDASEYAHVIDGQQRLTTLTILFAVLRKLLSGARDTKANSLDERFYRKAGILGRELKPRLKLRDDSDAAFFARYIQHEDGLDHLDTVSIESLPESQQRITQVARYFLNQLTPQKARPQKEVPLGRLKEFVLQRCVVILISTYDSDAAFTIFTVLNKRGLDLSAVDILKADILGAIQRAGKLSPEDMEQYAMPWEDLEQKLGREGFEDLINYTRIIHHQGQPRTVLIKEFRNDVIGNRRGLQRNEVIKDYLTPYGDALTAIRTKNYYFYVNRPETDTIAQINELFGWLNQVGNADWTPPAILYLSKKRSDADSLLTFFKRLERLAVFLMMNRKDADERAERYRAVLADIKRDIDMVLDARSSLQLTAEECQSLRERLDGDVYTIQGATRRYILLRLDGTLVEGRIMYALPDKITIEHVLPQKPSSSWLTIWSACWADSEVRKRYTNRLANLVLLTRKMNADAANRTFSEKKQIFFNDAKRTPFALTAGIQGYKDWKVETVQARQERLLAILYKLWDIADQPEKVQK